MADTQDATNNDSGPTAAAAPAVAPAAGPQPNNNNNIPNNNESNSRAAANNNNNNNNNTNGGQQPNIRRFRIRAPQGGGGVGTVRLNFNGRRVSINQGAGAGGIPFVDGFGSIQDPRLRHPANFNPNNNNQQPPNGGAAAVGLPRLEPQVLPDSQQQHQDEQKHQDDEQFGDFKCSICYEIMKDPAGCGKCSARFCFGCLSRVAQSRNNNNNNKTRCPLCRAPFDTEDIEKDGALKRRMEQAPSIPCRYQGCETLCLLTQISEHEANCPHVKIQCRFKPFGCNWTGKRGDYSHHEETDCHLAKISEFVDRHRKMQAEFSHRLAHLQQNVAATGGMLEVQRMRERQQICSSNLFQMALYVHMMTCCTPHFLLTKDTWAKFHFQTKERAKVSNIISLIPTGVFLAKVMGATYQQVLWRASSSLDTEDKVLDLVDAILSFLISSCLAIIICLSFFVDGGTSEKWKPLPVPHWLARWVGGGNSAAGATTEGGASNANASTNTTNVLEYGVECAFAAVFAFVMESYSGALLQASLLWLFLLLTSTVFPSLLTCMAELINASPTAVPPTPEKVISYGRAVRPLLFGLRCGPLAAMFGPLACLDAAILIYLVKDFIKGPLSSHSVFEHGRLLGRVPIPVLYLYSGTRFGLKATAFQDVSLFQTFDFLVVAVLLLGVNCLVLDFVHKGIRLGANILTISRSRVMTHDPTGFLLRVDYSGVGMACFSIWMLLLAAIAIT